MKTLRSALLWAIGSAFFTLTFLILSAGLCLLSRPRVFSLARFLFFVQTKIMGIRLTVSGLTGLDRTRTYLIMGNHESLFDLFVIPAAIPLTYVAVEAANHFSIPLWGSLITRWGCIPIHRNHLEKAKQSLEIARQRLREGTSIIILPEGHRTLTGEMGEFKKGPFHLARQAGADILPFAISGLFDYHPKGAFHLNPKPVRVIIGSLIPYGTVADMTPEQLRDHVRDIIADLADVHS
ncbi:MAG: lysophospholipid acyltransferase family protein [Desulfobacteraceae bacterium]|jgi:1-acyl-sn-glycerol-3-phosphate acyltransferase|nr:lysophospholipid acyltransferase family protein [Desulfobacteraceae bacterium]